jgi:Uma2 family endonuclease
MTRTSPRMTVEEFLKLPDDGVERWLIDGRLRSYKLPYRTFNHSNVMSKIGYALLNWSDAQPKPRGRVVCGRCGVQPSREQETVFGVDVAYLQPDLVARNPDGRDIVRGVPALIVDILSIEDRSKYVAERVDKYMEFGVPHVWIVDADRKTAVVHQPPKPPFIPDGFLGAEPELSGLSIPLAGLFD